MNKFVLVYSMTQFGLVVGTDVSEEYTAPIFRTKVIKIRANHQISNLKTK